MKVKIAAILACIFVMNSSIASASNAEHNWIVRGRGVFVKADVRSNVKTLGGGVDVSTDQVPELDFTRFFNKNFAAELILATTTHQVTLNGSVLGGSQDLGSVNLLPPTLTLQYHLNPEGKIRPYVGAGLNYTFFYNQKSRGIATSVKYNDSVGYALQAGFDYMISDRVGINFDIKKIYLETDVVVNKTYKAKVNLDPWLIGAGISYRF